MLEPLLNLLAELGLDYQDYKHRKRVRKKEKEDGIKRPFEKYALQPSAITLFVAIIIVTLGSFLFFNYQRKSVFPKDTRKELSEMSDRMENWKENLGHYPQTLDELIGNSPIQQHWANDAWDRPYKFSINEDGNEFLIISAGSDGQFGTDDDISSIK